MKRETLSLGALVMAMLLGGAGTGRAIAADDRPPAGPPGLGRAVDHLDLTPEQQPTVAAAVDAYQSALRQARADLLQQMKGVLTPTQYAQFEREATAPPPPRGGRPGQAAAAPTSQPATVAPPADGRVPVTFSGGYDLDPRDGGRPVVLIAGALGVPIDVFRDTFTHVRPAGAGQEPQPADVRRNKQALLQGLSSYGVTNDRLDEVSNAYRYNRSAGETWHHTPATAVATVAHGRVTSVTITDPGAGYTSPPVATVPGLDAQLTATVRYATDLATNGSIGEVTVHEAGVPR